MDLRGCGGVEIKCAEKRLWQRDDCVRKLWADGGGEEGGGVAEDVGDGGGVEEGGGSEGEVMRIGEVEEDKQGRRRG